ncbi:MAG: ABC transporter ATP-binding protein, partial [Suipraeoptans sp.]
MDNGKGMIGSDMISIENVSFAYKQSNCSEDTLDNNISNIDLKVEPGELIVLCGRSGCGKTTITRLINGLIPNFYEGRLSGKVVVDGKDIGKQSLAKISKHVGSVFQNPRSQFFNVDTTSELAFGCENLAIPKEEILNRISEAADIFSMKELMGRSIFALSGGEKQRIACGSIYATNPDVFVMDEPSSNLDASSIAQLREVLGKLKSEGKTIVVSEHRLYYLMDIADRFIYMDNGEIREEFDSTTINELSKSDMVRRGLRTRNLNEVERTVEVNSTKEELDTNRKFSIRNMVCKRKDEVVLNIDKLDIQSGEIVAVIGENGAGKSTFAECFCGLLNNKGSFSYGNKILKNKERTNKSYMVMQDVNHQLFCESVEEEVTLNLSEEQKSNANEVLKMMDIKNLSETHPLALSGGQKQRVAIAGAVCSEKEILIFDEPTSGLDYTSMMSTCGLVEKAAKSAGITLVITHDIEFIMGCCTSVIHIENGRVRDNYSLNESNGIDKIKKYFMKKRRTEVNKKEKKKEGMARLMELAATKKPLIICAGILSVLASIASFIPYIAIYLVIREILGVWPEASLLEVSVLT